MKKREDLQSIAEAKEEIRELALLYCRGVDRIDTGLVRSLFAKNGMGHYAHYFTGTADEFCAALGESLPQMRYTGHYISNHLISVDGDLGEGEVYALAHHIMRGEDGGWVLDVRALRYLDSYLREDGRWKFAVRHATFDWITVNPIEPMQTAAPVPAHDLSYQVFVSPLFARETAGPPQRI